MDKEELIERIEFLGETMVIDDYLVDALLHGDEYAERWLTELEESDINTDEDLIEKLCEMFNLNIK